jgi:hypothetical protein
LAYKYSNGQGRIQISENGGRVDLVTAAARFDMKRNYRGIGLIVALCGACLVAGCQTPKRMAQVDDPQLVKFMQLLMPAKIEIQHYLTKPYDFDGSGNPNGLEVIVTTSDAFGDPVKCMGTFHFELYTLRMASGDKLGEQIANWPIEMDSEQTMLQYWDRLTHSYRFPLRLRDGVLPPGQYILNAQLATPAHENLFDSYEFSHGG